MSQTAIEEDGPMLLSIKQVAPILGLSEWQVRGLARDGHIRSTKVKNRTYIPASAVPEYVAQIGETA